MEHKFDRSVAEAQIVSSKVRGAYRTNSLFNFLLDNQDALNCRMRVKMLEGERPVVYCSIPQIQTQDVFP